MLYRQSEQRGDKTSARGDEPHKGGKSHDECRFAASLGNLNPTPSLLHGMYWQVHLPGMGLQL